MPATSVSRCCSVRLVSPLTTSTVIRVYCNGDSSFAQGGWRKVPFNTESFDANSEYDAATNYRFTATVAGYYRIHFTVRWASPEDQKGFASAIYENGSSVAVAAISSSGTAAQSVPVTTLQHCAVNDYIEFYVYNAATGAETISGGALYSFATIEYVRP